jgi:hypothetical protein
VPKRYEPPSVLLQVNTAPRDRRDEAERVSRRKLLLLKMGLEPDPKFLNISPIVSE